MKGVIRNEEMKQNVGNECSITLQAAASFYISHPAAQFFKNESQLISN